MKTIIKYFLVLCFSLLIISSCTHKNEKLEDTNTIEIGSKEQNKQLDNIEDKSYVDKLAESPRHQEWVEIDNNGKTIYSWLVFPENSENSPVVLLIHENRGLTDWVRNLADQIAKEGYIAIAPDLLSSYSDKYSKTSDFDNENDAIEAIYTLSSTGVLSDLQAVEKYAKTISAGNGKIVSVGFCWGGTQSFLLATQTQNLDAALVFYGTGPDDESAYDNISIPVYGFYGGNDQRVNATIPKTEEYMIKKEKTYKYKIYNGAGHAFMRLGEEKDALEANKIARKKAWERMKMIIDGLE